MKRRGFQAWLKKAVEGYRFSFPCEDGCAARNCGATVACPRAPSNHYRTQLHRLCASDARPSTARRPRPGRPPGQRWSTTTPGTTRAPRPCTTHRTAAHTRQHPPRTTLGRTPAHSNGARVERAPGLAGRAEVGVPCQPPPVPPNATTSPRDGLRAPVQAAHRPPSRDRRRRDNDRPVPPGPACNEGGF